MKKYLVLFALILIQGCSSSGGDDAAPAVKVNLLGAWDYQFTFQNSICDGLFPSGTSTVESLNGDTTKIGNILMLGETIDIDGFGNCSIIPLNELVTDWSGRPAEQTAADFTAYTVADNLGDNTIASYVLNSFTDRKIQETTTYTNGVVEIFVITR
jgi:hypothetical protein